MNQNTDLKFEERKTCYIYQAPQSSEEWMSARYGAITASSISEICDRSFFNVKKSPQELALTICGLTQNSYCNNLSVALQDGILGEKYIREWFSTDILKTPINEVGIALWKQDPFFRASLDGEALYNEEDIAIEIKIPGKINKKLIDVFHSWSKKLNNPHPDSYIFRSHYDQMTAQCVITGKTGCYYVVACINDGTSFYQFIDTDYDLWNNVLFPKAKKFHTQYVLPVIKQYDINVVMPQ
jgi:hypothetical protein